MDVGEADEFSQWKKRGNFLLYQFQTTTPTTHIYCLTNDGLEKKGKARAIIFIETLLDHPLYVVVP